ncbi:MAG: hypothetical protein ACRDYZ_07470, partial [Acidimicrobiales bacterium]
MSGGDLTYGVDIGGTKVLGVAMTPAGGVVAEARLPTPHVAIDPDEPRRGMVGAEVADAVVEVVRTLERAWPGTPPPAGPAGPA